MTGKEERLYIGLFSFILAPGAQIISNLWLFHSTQSQVRAALLGMISHMQCLVHLNGTLVCSQPLCGLGSL